MAQAASWLLPTFALAIALLSSDKLLSPRAMLTRRRSTASGA